MSAAHWVYLLGLVVLIGTVVAKKNVIAPAIVATFLTGLVYQGSVTTGLGAVFNAAISGTRELLPIFIIIALVTAMLGAMRGLGADAVMIRPLSGLFRNGHVSYLLLAAVTFLLSLAFWPTPVLPLIAAILLPAAVRAGLPLLGAALAIAIAGQGMALSSDYIMGVAPALSAEGADVPARMIADRATLIALIAGAVALAIAYFRDVRTKTTDPAAATEAAGAGNPGPAGPISAAGGQTKGAVATLSAPATEIAAPHRNSKGVLVAIAIPVLFAGLLAFMLLGRFTTLVPDVDEGLGAPLVGGTAALALVAISVIANRRGWLEDVGAHFTEGIAFSFRTMGMVIPVAGFVYIGLADYSAGILGLPDGAEAPAFLFDAVAAVQGHIPHTPVFAAFAMLIVGMLLGLDGNGWPGLPFTGSLAASLGDGADQVATLAAIAQNGASWTGGGTLVIWSSLIVVAGLTGVPVVDLARRLFIPVVTGLVVATGVATLVLL
ncbi:membrane protein [Mycolicibacterium litorale]|uniref:Membrane protein n=1 Tax=Mycolicibacterium litorale TaxID=758802 RepID=A0A6S6P061_9MYCO|nr:permease [Mycolicibacterium litorale]BCI51859.1 membrane protein [Mycolicibacterium litorale]